MPSTGLPQAPLALVTGATGAVGPRLVGALHSRGYRIRVLCLDRPAPGLFPDGVEAVVGDVNDASLVRAAVGGARLVMHLAALLHVTDPARQAVADYRRVNTEGTAIVVGEARRAGVERIIYFSTISVYGSTMLSAASEDTPVAPETPYSCTKCEAERLVLQAGRADGKPLGVVLRLAAVYGARVKGNYRTLVEALARKRFIPLGRGDNVRSLIYDRDAADAALLAAEHPGAPGRIFNVSDGEAHPLSRIIDAICRGLGRRPPRWSIPLAAARSAVTALEAVSSLLRIPPPVTRAAIDKYSQSAQISSERIRRELGFAPAYDLYRGWREAIEEMKSSGDLA
jgi:nucleoside-diphosphate-sugar epimerase